MGGWVKCGSILFVVSSLTLIDRGDKDEGGTEREKEERQGMIRFFILYLRETNEKGSEP